MATETNSLAAAVAGIAERDDVVALLRSYGRRIVPVDMGALGDDAPWRGPDVRGAWVLNPGEGAPIWLVEADTSDGRRDRLDRVLHRAARGVAHGTSALIVVAPGATELRVAVADERHVERCRSTRRQVDERALEAWAALTGPRDTPLALLRAYRLLRKRSVGAEFFRDVRAVVGEVTAAWTDGPSESADRHVLAITLLCRLMFLYFVQARGWLDGDVGYLAAMLLDPDADRLYSDRLEPLFFRVLNRAPEDRDPPMARAGIPYLNGGLFERTPLEVRYPALDLPDEVVRTLIGVLERYRFVEVERGGDHVALDPAMLGTVFESLMCPDARGRTGTFYTPPRFVDELADDALHVVLERDLGGPLASRLLGGATLGADEAAACRSVLDTLTVLDPAMGSGAFLVGVLDRLVRLRTAVCGETPAAATRTVVDRNLFGVDVSETAVTIAGLRLWLALAAVTGTEEGPVEPLPNLSHRLRRGNALLGLATFGQIEGVELDGAVVAELRELADAFAGAHGAHKASVGERLREAERRAAVSLLTGCAARVARRRVELEAERAPDLFGHAPASSRRWSRELAELDAREEEVRALLGRAVRGEWAPAFDFAVHFAPVLAQGGFDIVVGNPPWVRLANVGPDERRRLKAAYAWVAEAGDGRAFGAQPDLAVAFVQRGVALLRPGGALAMVVPAKLLTAGYAGAMRAGVLSEAPPLRVRDLSESPVALFAADVLPATLLLSRRPPAPGGLVQVDEGGGRTSVTTLDRLSLDGRPRGEWSLLGASAVDVFRRLVRRAGTVGERFDVRMGVKTGANDVFVGRDIDDTMNVTALRGRGVAPMRVVATDRLLFAHDVVNGEPLSGAGLPPRLLAWLEAHEEVLRGRVDAAPEDPLWRVFRVRPDALGHRVAWRDIGERLDAVYLPPVADGGPVALNTTYTVAVDSPAQGRRLAAWLCSAPARFVAAARAERALGGYRRFMGRNVGSVPIADVVIGGDPALDRVAAALEDAPEDPRTWDALDRLAADALDLSASELAAIRGEADRLSLRSHDLRAVLGAVGA